jgi:hypothetical protein
MTDPFDALERLARLRDQNVLSDEEFAAEKARILKGLVHPGDAPAAGTRPFPLLRGFGPNGWIPAGIAAALAGGAVLAFFVWSDIDSASTREREGEGDGARRNVVAKSASTRPVSLATVIKFANGATCAPSEGFGEVISQMRAAAGVQNAAADSAIRLLGVEEAIVPEVIRSESGALPVTLVQIQVEGDWNGLHLRAVKTAIWGTKDVSTLQLRFSEPAEQTRSLLRQLGFKLDKIGELAAVEGADGGYSMVGVEALDEGSALTCARDNRAKGGGEDRPAS